MSQTGSSFPTSLSSCAARRPRSADDSVDWIYSIDAPLRAGLQLATASFFDLFIYTIYVCFMSTFVCECVYTLSKALFVTATTYLYYRYVCECVFVCSSAQKPAEKQVFGGRDDVSRMPHTCARAVGSALAPRSLYIYMSCVCGLSNIRIAVF